MPDAGVKQLSHNFNVTRYTHQARQNMYNVYFLQQKNAVTTNHSFRDRSGSNARL